MNTSDLTLILDNSDYNRQRVDPRIGDPLYIHLSDLKLFIDSITNRRYESILDYGCGGSPYKQLFQTPRYLRADYTNMPNLDYLIGEDGKIPTVDNQFDLVLSTQVLEHVADSQCYLREACRVLRPGGTLALTTHGIWEDHGCPYDFYRWTADGIALELKNAGFDVCRVSKLTTGPRAVAINFFHSLHRFPSSRRSGLGLTIWLLKQFGTNSSSIHRWLDVSFPNNRIVSDSTEEGHRLYLALGCIAVKPN